MIEENGSITRSNPTFKPNTLLESYGIPIDNLSYDYIESCNNISELERIVTVLRSGEEGNYPDLQERAEGRLRLLSPNNRHLHVSEPALNNRNLSPEEWNSITSDVSIWKNEMSIKDLQLSEENNNSADGMNNLPPIRRPYVGNNSSVKIENQTKAKLPMTDYNVWGTYNSDPVLKMDLKIQQDIEKKEEQIRKTQDENHRLNMIVQDVEKMSETEKRKLAEEEKNRGNEFYQAKDFKEAEKYYSASIAIWPTANAYNNRAQCYLKHCKYSAALADTNSTLALEPNNVKALFRRGVALQHQNKFREALADMTAVLRVKPKEVEAQRIAKELSRQILTLPRSVRILTDAGFGKPKTVVEIDSDELGLPSTNISNTCFEVNEWGLPKVACECKGSPQRLLPNPRPPRSINYINDIKPCKFNATLIDANRILAREPGNVKALFRRGVALYHHNKLKEALLDMTGVLERQPNHQLAQNLAKELQRQIVTLLHPDRTFSDEDLDELMSNSGELGLPPSYISEVDKLPNVACQCNGGSRLRQLNLRPSQTVPFKKNNTSFNPTKNPKIIELSDEVGQLNSERSAKLEIIEVEKVEDDPVEEFFMPKKCNIVDRRTKKYNSGLNLENSEVKIMDGDCEVPVLYNEDSSLETQFDDMDPLLDEILGVVEE